MCGATAHVRFTSRSGHVDRNSACPLVPIANIAPLIDHRIDVGRRRSRLAEDALESCDFETMRRKVTAEAEVKNTISFQAEGDGHHPSGVLLVWIARTRRPIPSLPKEEFRAVRTRGMMAMPRMITLAGEDARTPRRRRVRRRRRGAVHGVVLWLTILAVHSIKLRRTVRRTRTAA